MTPGDVVLLLLALLCGATQLTLTVLLSLITQETSDAA